MEGTVTFRAGSWWANEGSTERAGRGRHKSPLPWDRIWRRAAAPPLQPQAENGKATLGNSSSRWHRRATRSGACATARGLIPAKPSTRSPKKTETTLCSGLIGQLARTAWSQFWISSSFLPRWRKANTGPWRSKVWLTRTRRKVKCYQSYKTQARVAALLGNMQQCGMAQGLLVADVKMKKTKETSTAITNLLRLVM